MTLQTTSLNNKKQALTLLALSLLLIGGRAAVAQEEGLQAGPMGTLSPSTIIGNDADTMLPPEVVPLDPMAANRMMQNQAQSRAAQMSMPETQASPGTLTADSQMNGMQTAQDARKAAYDQLT